MLAPLAGVTPTCSTTPRQEELFWQLFPTSPSCLFSACPSSAPAPGPLPSTRAASALLSFHTSHPRVAPAHPVLSCTSVPSHRLPRFLGSGLSASSSDTCPAPPRPASLHRPLGPQAPRQAPPPAPSTRPAPPPPPAGRTGRQRGTARGREARRARPAGLLEHGFFLLLFLLLPVHHRQDDVPLLLGQVAQVGQLGHRGRHGGRAGTPGPHGRGHLRGLARPSSMAWVRRERTFGFTPGGGRVPARLTAAPSRRRDWAAREPGLSWSSACTQPRRRPPLFWWPWRGAGARPPPAAQPSRAGAGAHGAEDARGSARMLRLDRLRASAVREESLGGT